MNNIKLLKLIGDNFKGLKHIELNVDGKLIRIYADNGQCKTTLFDLFCWVLFGKNSEGNAKFNIKPLKADGTEVSGVDCVGTVILEKDGIKTTFSRNYHEVWRTPTGKTEKVFDTHKTDYSVNEGNVSQKVFQERVADIVDEKVFKMLTDVYAFTSLKDKEQREILFKVLGGDIPLEDIIASNVELKPLEALLKTTKIEFLESETKGQIKKNKDEKSLIPSRLDELNNMLVEVNVEEKKNEIALINEELATIDEEIVQANIHNEEITDKKNELAAKESKYQNEYAKAKNLAEKAYVDSKYKEIDVKQHEYDNEYNKLKAEVDTKYDNAKNIEELKKANDELNKLISKTYTLRDSKINYSKEIDAIDTRNKKIREDIAKLKDSKFEFDESKTICQTCKRPLENIENHKKDLEEKFNNDKADNLNWLQDTGNKGLANKKEFISNITEINTETEKIEDEIATINENIEKIKSLIVEKPPVESELLTKLLDEIATLKTEIRNIPELEITFEGMQDLKTDTTNLKAFLESATQIDTISHKITKNILEGKLKALTKEIESLGNNSKVEIRINELMDRERELANKIAALEGTINLLNIFTTTKANLISTKINDRFKTISFKLFETFIGSDGVKEVCEATINGVPYSNANSAAKINAGLEIISILSEYYEASCPIFIDGCESITHPQATDSQLITLNVTDFTNADGTTSSDKIEAFKTLHPTAEKINNMYMEVIE